MISNGWNFSGASFPVVGSVPAATGAPEKLPEVVRVIRSTAGLHRGETLYLDRDGLFTGPAFVGVRAEDVRRGWGFFFAEAAA